MKQWFCKWVDGMSQRGSLVSRQLRSVSSDLPKHCFRELELAQKLGARYCLFRVFEAGTKNARVQTLPNVFSFIVERKVDLCLMLPHDVKI